MGYLEKLNRLNTGSKRIIWTTAQSLNKKIMLQVLRFRLNIHNIWISIHRYIFYVKKEGNMYRSNSLVWRKKFIEFCTYDLNFLNSSLCPPPHVTNKEPSYYLGFIQMVQIFIVINQVIPSIWLNLLLIHNTYRSLRKNNHP